MLYVHVWVQEYQYKNMFSGYPPSENLGHHKDEHLFWILQEKTFPPLYFKQKTLMTILDLIKAACKTKGVPEKYAERIQKTFKIEDV